MCTSPTLEYDILNLLIRRVHDAPTHECPRPVNTNSLVDVPQLVAAVAVNVLQHLPRVLVRSSATALHIHFDDVEGIKNCAN